MIQFLKKLWRNKRGNALVMAGAALPLIVGSAGLASDTIQWALWKRQIQRAADSAAMAGVYAKVQGKDVGTCTDIAGATYTSPVAWDLKKNSHVNITPTCAVTNPPSTGTYATDAMAVKVDLSVQKKLSFSGMFMSAAPTISASATATIVPAGKYCVVSLENTSATGITATGNADVDMGCGMITNSTSMTAAVATGSSEVNACPIAAVGGIAASNNWASGTVLQPFTIAQADPFANVYPPTTFPSGNCPDLRVQSNETKTDWTTSDYKAMPGLTGAYCVGNMVLQGNVSLPAGVYVLDGGSLTIGAQAHVTCTGCTFVLTSRNAATNPQQIGNVDMNGGAEIDLKAPGTDATDAAAAYQGIMIYQDRRAVDGTSANQQSKLNGNSESTFQGAFYFPSQQVTFNGTAGMTTDCLQLVARRVYYSGNMDISNTCDADWGSHAFDGKKVRLVA
jgi:Flp pilus assembly protein TadG